MTGDLEPIRPRGWQEGSAISVVPAQPGITVTVTSGGDSWHLPVVAWAVVSHGLDCDGNQMTRLEPVVLDVDADADAGTVEVLSAYVDGCERGTRTKLAAP
jgi:hypothetical protein